MGRKITYEIRGQVERICFFNVGLNVVKFDFTGGMVNSSGTYPAQYITDNPRYQKAIEGSSLFRRGEIIKANEEIYDVDDSENDISDNKTPEDMVTNLQQARALLMKEPYNLPLSVLQTKNGIKTKALELGLTFSNWI